MDRFQRYAVYYAPEPGAFADFAASWLGWDAESGSEVVHPDVNGLPLPVADITATPRKYGFHGTIKPPFRLAEGSSDVGLMADLEALASNLAPVTLDGLELSLLGRFLALTPSGDQRALADLAAKVVEGLDQHRRPASEAELKKRRGAGLSERQDANLMKWGYPYVMEEFRFHLTLSGKLSKPEAQATQDTLAPVLAPLLPRPFSVSELCLFGEASDGRFHLIHRYTLSGASAATIA